MPTADAATWAWLALLAGLTMAAAASLHAGRTVGELLADRIVARWERHR